MIKQNIVQLYPTISELQIPILLELYQDSRLQQFHTIIQSIKSKFPMPLQLDIQAYPDSEDLPQYFAKKYQPIIIDMQSLLNNPEAKIKLYKNAIYFGFLENGLRQGLGILIKQNNQIYEGEFNKDKKEGLGFEILKNNSFYYGHYLQGLPHGEGIFQAKNQSYIGQWLNGKKHGIGWCEGQFQEYYLGQWEIGKCNGLCLHIKKDIFFGEVSNDLKHGDGQEIFENGDQFKGEYRNGKPNGYGEYQWGNENNYKGQFTNGLRNGEGSWQSQVGREVNRYQGFYVNDKKNGKGIFNYANGTIYEGHFQDDKRCGYGEMIWPDRATYKGYWNNNLMDGEGIYNYQNMILKGLWRNNQLQSYDNVRMALGNFPVVNKLKEIKEDEEIHSQLAEEPDIDEIGDQFKNDQLGHHNRMESLKSREDQNKFPILRQQFDLLSVMENQLSQIKQNYGQSVAIQTESKKRFLPKLQSGKHQSTDYGSRIDRSKFDSISYSPKIQTRETDKSKSQQQSNRSVCHKVRGKKTKQVLLSKKEENIWQLKMAKLKLSPKKYSKLWNHRIVSEIKSILYPPVWKPPSHLI